MTAKTQNAPSSSNAKGNKLLTPRSIRWLIIGMGLIGLLLSAGLVIAFVQL